MEQLTQVCAALRDWNIDYMPTNADRKNLINIISYPQGGGKKFLKKVLTKRVA